VVLVPLWILSDAGYQQTKSWLVSVQVGQSAIWCRGWHPGRRQP